MDLPGSGQAGRSWLGFRGPLSHKSHRQAVVIVASLFTWLPAAQYLTANPWVLVIQKTGDDREKNLLDTAVLSDSAASEIFRFSWEAGALAFALPDPVHSAFYEAVRLRSAELLQARLGDLRLEPEGWVTQVQGKGARNRVAAVPGQAFDALQEYLDVRGLCGIETAPAEAPLLASAMDLMAPIGYQALNEHVRSWISRAVSASALPSSERLKLAGAFTHIGSITPSEPVPLRARRWI